MNRQGVPLGRVFGIPISLDYSWFIIVALFSATLAQGYYPARFGDWPTALYWFMGLITSLSLFGSVLLHEFGHALTAMAYNIPVHRIRLMIFGGVAELGDESPNAGAEFLIALAGPLVSIVTGAMAFVAWAGLRISMGFGVNLLGIVPQATPFDIGGASLTVEALLALFSYLAAINVLLAVFNMIPGFPLDGGRVFRAFLWGVSKDYMKSTRIAVGVGRAVAFGFIGWGIFRILTGNFGGGLWTILIGLFMQGAARSELQMQRTKALLQERFVAHLLMHNPNLTRWVQPGLRAPSPDHHVTPDTNLWTALRRMDRNELGQIPVVREGQLLGIVRREDIIGYLQVLMRYGNATA